MTDKNPRKDRFIWKEEDIQVVLEDGRRVSVEEFRKMKEEKDKKEEDK